MSGSILKRSFIWIGNDAPTNPSVNDLWVDTSTGSPVLKVCISVNPITFSAQQIFQGGSILTSKGDVLTHNGSATIRLPVGLDGQTIVADATAPAGIKWADGPPATLEPHAETHENGGDDEINVAGLSGLLADPQTPAAHTHVLVDITDAGTLAAQDADAVAITGGNIDVRSTGDFVTAVGFAMSEQEGLGDKIIKILTTEDLTETRRLDIKVNNADRALTIAGDATVSGTNTGDQTNIPGNAATATALQTARTINGTSFDGTANITLANDSVDNNQLRNSGALSVIGRSANSAGDPADISATAASGAVLRESGHVLGFGTLAPEAFADNTIAEGRLNISDVTTKNVSTSAHGFAPKAPNDTRQWLRGDASWATVPGRLIVSRELSSGTSFTTGSTTKFIVAQLIGAGGGGGGVSGAANQSAAAGGGGSGAWLSIFVAVASSTAYTISLGTAGNGGSAGANDGSAGGNTTMTIGATTYTAPGGSGGTGMAAGTAVAFARGGAGGALATNGDFNSRGGNGQRGIRLSSTVAASGNGGEGPYGGGGQGLVAAATGNNGGRYGGGGSGAMTASGVNRAGGNGGSGMILLWEFE
jgi:hypothetical protein